MDLQLDLDNSVASTLACQPEGHGPGFTRRWPFFNWHGFLSRPSLKWVSGSVLSSQTTFVVLTSSPVHYWLINKHTYCLHILDICQNLGVCSSHYVSALARCDVSWLCLWQSKRRCDRMSEERDRIREERDRMSEERDQMSEQRREWVNELRRI